MNIIGQPIVVAYIEQGLKNNRLSPSLLFAGPDGVGKKTTAIELAKRFNATEKSDLLIINKAMQAMILKEKEESQTAIKIESVRTLEKFVHLRPAEGERRVAIIEDAHKLTPDAANALLKVLEEPPNNAQIILLAIDERSLPTTILSRCAVLRFKPLSPEQITRWLIDEFRMPLDEADQIGRRANGSFARALLLKDEGEPSVTDLSSYQMDEFFELLGATSWKKDGRKQAEAAITTLIEKTQKKLEAGDRAQEERLSVLLSARKQMDRHVPPRLVLENLYLKLESPFKKIEAL